MPILGPISDSKVAGGEQPNARIVSRTNVMFLPVVSLAEPAVDPSLPPPPRAPEDFPEEFRDALNLSRVQHGVPSVSLHVELMAAARFRAAEIVARRNRTGWHDGWFDTVRRYWHGTGCIGEVLVGAYEPDHHTISGVHALHWYYISQAHKDQLLKPHHRHVGIGVAHNDFFDFMLCVLLSGPC